jgi:hypothetical protein
MGIAAFIGMWLSVAVFLWNGGRPSDFAGALFANSAVTMLTIEMTVMAAATSLLMFREAKRLGIRGPWLILFLAVSVGFGVVFPIFLAFRERRLEAQSG